MAISSRNNVQVIHHSPHRTFRRSSTLSNRIPSSTSPHQISITTSRKMPVIIHSNSSIKSRDPTTPPPVANSYPCSFSRSPKAPTRHLFKNIITITVGTQKAPFLVHRERFCAASPFFAAALNPSYSFRESAANTLHLPSARPCDFEYLVQWIYTGTLDHEELDCEHPAYFRLIRLWLLADELQVEGCKNGIVDMMAKVADRTNSVPTPDDTRTVFGEEGVREEEGLRRLVVDLFAWKKTDQLVEAHEDSWDEHFMRLLVCRLKRMDVKEKGRAPWRADSERCRLYHEHHDGQSTCGVLEARK
ncbi:MAG: hypothetical protein L6R39_003838 [Caloplaca ligustica]|nr:MAG: hypothetical protein L6R39_003838 [Caloplaca ligustica]